jgi:hypothetical protein
VLIWPQIMEPDDEPKATDAIREFLRGIGAKGGKRGGKRRWKDISAEERSRQMKAIRAGSTKKSRNPKAERSAPARQAIQAKRKKAKKD